MTAGHLPRYDTPAIGVEDMRGGCSPCVPRPPPKRKSSLFGLFGSKKSSGPVEEMHAGIAAYYRSTSYLSEVDL